MRITVAALLAMAVLTVWVRDRWAVSATEVAVFAAVVALMVFDQLRHRAVRPGLPVLLLIAPAGWAMLQVALGWSVVPQATQESALYWLAAASFAYLGQRAVSGERGRDRILLAMLAAGSAICFAGILQTYTSGGKIFWMFASGYQDRVFGPFVSPNHYAAFVELLTPIALVTGFRRRQDAWLIVAAGMAASVVASGSRAGIALEMLEVVLVCVAAWRRGWMRGCEMRSLGVLAVATGGFTLMVGWQLVHDRFEQHADFFGMRRELMLSALDMFRSQPWHGFGLGTWTSVYPRFALVDPGAVVNHAHNEWLQWAGEGGLPLLLLMLGVAVMVTGPALRSLWGVGVLAVLVHSLVDYPFLHLGLAAWIFVLIGALGAYRSGHGWPQLRRSISGRARVVMVAVLLLMVLASAASVRLAWADVLYRRGTVLSLREAVRLVPAQAEFRVAIAAADPSRRIENLEAALAANPYCNKARIELAGEMEARGDLRRAELLLLDAAARERLYAPAWALANFYFRTQRSEPFWRWARAAAQLNQGDLSPLIELCFAFDGNAETVWKRIAAGPHCQRELVVWLARRQRYSDVAGPAVELVRITDPGQTVPLLDLVDQELGAGYALEAARIWRAMASRGLVAGTNTPGSLITNGDFRMALANRGFDWRLNPAEWLNAVPAAPGLALSLSGSQPEQGDLMVQMVPLRAGHDYLLRWRYRTADLPSDTGLSWLIPGVGATPLLASDGLRQQEWKFRATGEAVRLLLSYRRVAGTVRTSGTLYLRDVQLMEDPAPVSK